MEDVRGVPIVNKDGSVFRADASHLFVEANEKAEEGGVATKDVILDDNVGLWVRIFLPSTSQDTRLPLMLYFHGGGFCLASPALPDFHNFSVKLAATVGAIVVSVAYRLAPEHRLPAAYEDCHRALQWVRSHAAKEKPEGFEPETWVRAYADLEKIYVVGDSAGANIAHQVMLRCEAKVKEWIKGAILLQPFFGGEERKQSEVECGRDAFLSLDLSDAFWRLSLPAESDGDRDHPFCNPCGPQSPHLTNICFPPLLVAIGGRDMLRDRALEYCERLKKEVEVEMEMEVIVFEEEEHGFYALNLHSASTQQLMQHISRFLHA